MISQPSRSELGAREAIKQLKYLYARHLDGQNWEEWGSLFAENARANVAIGQLDGRASIVDYGRRVVGERYERTLHMMHNPVIEVDGDTATGKWYLEAFLARHDDIAGLQYGEYDETYRRTKNGWRITRLEIRVIAETGDDVKYSREVDDRRREELRRIEF